MQLLVGLYKALGPIVEWIVICMIALAGVGFLCHAIWRIGRWPKVPAKVVFYWIRRNEDESSGHPFYHAVVRFETLDGQETTAVSHCGSWRRKWELGADVHVRYCPTEPHEAEIACFSHTWGPPLALIGLAITLALVLKHFDLL